MALVNDREQVPDAGDAVSAVRPVTGLNAVVVDFASGKSVWYSVGSDVPQPDGESGQGAVSSSTPPAAAPDWSALLAWGLSLDFLAGYRSYLAAAGLVGLGVYQLSQGDATAGVQSVLAGVAVLGVRGAVAAKE